MKYYISFDYMLSFYGLIPERAYTYTCATCGLKLDEKNIVNTLSNYIFIHIPQVVYNLGLTTMNDGVNKYIVATKEKALCDKLYTISQIMDNVKELEYLLFEDLRIDEDDFWQLDKELIFKIAPLYNSVNLNLLVELIKKQN